MSTSQDLAELVRTLVERSTARQGLPHKVGCTDTLKTVATAIRAVKGGK